VAFDVAVEGQNEHGPVPSTGKIFSHCQAFAGVKNLATPTPIEVGVSMTTVGVVKFSWQMFVDHISS
jgi:hypothetical protein